MLSTRWSDNLSFEWPWVRALVCVLVIAGLMLPQWSSSFIWAACSGCCVLLALTAIGLGVERKYFRVIVAGLAGGLVIGLLMPPVVVRVIWFIVAGLIGIAAGFLRYHYPYHGKRVRENDSYTIGPTNYSLCGFRIKNPRVFYLRPELLDQLMELAAYADGFLERHGMRYVVAYGTLLGVVRHQGPMPWDDDVDFTIYRPQDIARLEQSFAALAADADREGYCLTAHNDYWKLSRKGFWRFPAVDFYRAAIYQPIESIPEKAKFGHLQLSVPDRPRDHVVASYGESSLTEVVFKIPFWDSGFLPAAFTRLFGIRLVNLASDAYEWLYGDTSR